MKQGIRNRAYGAAVLAGGLLFGAATLMHPPAANPWIGRSIIGEINESIVRWQWDHGLMALAAGLWLLGLAGAERFARPGSGPDLNAGRSLTLGRNESGDTGLPDRTHAEPADPPFRGTAPRLFTISLALWLAVLAMELTFMPTVAEALGVRPERGAELVFVGLFAFGIVAGDIAMLLAWLGAVLLGGYLLGKPGFPRWLAHAGWVTGAVGAAGILAGLLLPEQSLPIYALTSGPPFAWTLALGWRMLREKAPDD